MINEFWKNWKNKTHVEKRAILSVKRAMDFLLTNVPKDKLISVYIKGTFVTRELKEKSDVDILPIVKNKSEMRKLKAVRDRNKERLRPSELLPMSYTELTQKNRPWGRADTFLRDLEHHKWLYGKKLKKSDYPMRTWDKMFLDEILMLKNKTIPLYRKGKFSFTQFIEEVGELAKEINKPKLRDKEIDRENLSGEFADVTLQLFTLAKMLDIDINRAIETKIEILKKRHGL